jgi:CubicO group peptidase (beta-lactamase class C family)
MKILPAFALLFLAATASPTAPILASGTERPAIPVRQNPAKGRALELLEALNSRSEPAMRAFVNGNFSAQALVKESANDRVDDLLQAASMVRGGSMVRWEDLSDVQGRLIFDNRMFDRLQSMTVTVSAAAPFGITDWTRPRDLPSQSPPPATDKAVADRLGHFIERLARYGYFSGNYLLWHDGKTIAQGAYGKAERNFDVPVRLDTKFSIASMTKSFTAVAVGQLVEQGKLSLDDPLSKFVPDAAGGDKIKLKHLLSHTSGLPDIFDKTDFFSKNPRNFRTMSDFLKIADKSAPKKNPGEAWSYSNLNFLYLGKAVEIASGETYQRYIEDHIFKPAGMTESGFWDHDSTVPNMAHVYEYQFIGEHGFYRNVDGLTGMGAMPFGGAESTLGDMAKFGRALQAGVLLKPETLREFNSPKPELHSTFYGYGFFFAQEPGTNIIRWGNGGNSMGGCHQFTIIQDGKTSWMFITLTNGGLANCRPVYDEATRLIVQRMSLRK